MKLPKRLKKTDRAYLPKRQRRSIQLDSVHPTDLRIYNGRFYCDDCSHYSASQKVCTLGYKPLHTRAEQQALYDLSGRMAFCRAIEID